MTLSTLSPLTLLGLAFAAWVLLKLWTRRRRPARTVAVIDGDTVVIDGRRCRLHGIDAPEMPGPAGRTARGRLQHFVADGPADARLRFRRHGTDRYGRWLVTLYDRRGRNVNRLMVADGQARAYGRYSALYLGAQMRAALGHKGNWRKGWFVHPERVRRAR